MKVVWLSDRNWSHFQPDWTTGGAELSDQLMVSRRPDDIELSTLAPGFLSDGHGLHLLQQADRVIVSGHKRFSPEEVGVIASTRPVVWIHDIDTLGHPLHGFASMLVCLTPLHQLMERSALHTSPSWAGPELLLCPGWLDTSPFDDPKFDVPSKDRGETALFAHRPVWSKNLPGATRWAQSRDITMRVMMARPRADVLDAMAESRYFVLLSHIVDPGPLAVMEAQMAGCELAVNELVGYYNLPREELKHAISNQDEVFWSIVKGERP